MSKVNCKFYEVKKFIVDISNLKDYQDQKWWKIQEEKRKRGVSEIL